jgi:hypothetical protein
MPCSLPLLAVVERSKVYDAGVVSVRLPTPEDLIVMKAIAHRPKDLIDIQTVIDAHPDLDIDRIKYWVKSFAEVLELPGLWTDIAGMFE